MYFKVVARTYTSARLSALIMTLLAISACTETSLFTMGGCKSDSDCEAGYECDTDKGECVEAEEDGDFEMDGDSETDGDNDFDPEEWNDSCDTNPPRTEIIIPCKKEDCTKVNPPQCWTCTWVSDSEQNGDRCMTADDTQGKCADGVCTSAGDGDSESETADGDQSNPNCADINGRCAKPGRDCRPDEEPTSGNMGCEGLCCIPEGQTDCVGEGQRGNSLDENSENDVCCKGLDQVSNAVPDDDGECIAAPDGSFYCIRCGNDTCGPAENFCRCPEDCQPNLQCEDDQDCPDTWCADLIGGAGCQLHTYDCDDEECVETETNIESSVCNEDSGQCDPIVPEEECGDQDGYCTDVSHNCNDGYYASEDTLGCSGGFTARCCLPEESCQDDGDCPDDWCQGFSGLPNCFQFSYNCSSHTCNESQVLYENYLCVEETGKCVELNAPQCVLNGGYCSTSSQGCSNGYYQADSASGCPGGASARCCLQDNSDCEEDSDCGGRDCANTQDGKCIQFDPVCSASGQCQEQSQILSNHTCNTNTGLCEESTTTKTCEEANGECTITFLACQENYHVDQNAQCDAYPLYVCCVKD